LSGLPAGGCGVCLGCIRFLNGFKLILMAAGADFIVMVGYPNKHFKFYIPNMRFSLVVIVE
jgi:hypothetical protein